MMMRIRTKLTSQTIRIISQTRNPMTILLTQIIRIHPTIIAIRPITIQRVIRMETRRIQMAEEIQMEERRHQMMEETQMEERKIQTMEETQVEERRIQTTAEARMEEHRHQMAEEPQMGVPQMHRHLSYSSIL